ncbi:MAG: tetratricopeptide repeat protein, partial [Cyanobacteria bacterium P01_E01_bin.42]
MNLKVKPNMKIKFMRSLSCIVFVPILILLSFSIFGNLPAFATSGTSFSEGIEARQPENYHSSWLALTQAIEKGENLAAAYSDRCLLQIYQKKYQNAKDDCTLALRYDRSNSTAYLHRGLAYYYLGNYQDAIANYTRVVELDPDKFTAYYNRALAYFELQNYERALQDYDRSLATNTPLTPEQIGAVYNDRGLAYAKMGNLEQAISDLSVAIHCDRNNPDFYFNRGYLGSQDKNYLAAIRDFSRALERDSDRAEFYINRGLVWQKMGKIQAALQDLHQGANCLYARQDRKNYRVILNLIKRIESQLASQIPVIA